jgi:hypothetical protein
MKKVVLVGAKSLEIVMFSIAFIGLAIAIVNLCIGNYGSTASYEF